MRNKKYKYIHLIMVIFLSAVISACGGSGSSGGIDGTGSPEQKIIASGTVNNESNQLEVNGIGFDTSNTDIQIDGNSGVLSDVETGQVLIVSGELDADSNNLTAAAETIEYVSNVIGPIASIDEISSSFRVLGQNISLDSSTVLGNGLTEFSDLQHLQTVRISGLISSNRDIQATRIDIINTENYQVVGMVNELDTGLMTFRINELIVSYQNAELTDNIINGEIVKVNGTQFSEDGSFIADTVQVVNISFGEAEDIFSIEGLVTTFVSATDFSVSDIDIVTTTNTIIENGSLDDLGLDARLQIEGQLNTQGSVVARRISIIHTGPISFNGSVNLSSGDIVYTIESSESDRGLWVTLTDLNSGASLFVEKIENGQAILECELYALNSINDGVCYLDNNGQTTWQIRIRGNSNNITTNYQLTAYFRRAPFSSAQQIAPGGSVQVSLNAGDRNLYRLPTTQAPAGSLLAVMVDGLQNNGQLYIQGDSRVNGNTERLFDCRLGNQVKDSDDIVDRICWLQNDDVDNWYLSLDSVDNQQYTIHVDFIVPTPLSLGVEVNGTLTGPFDKLYTFNTDENDLNVGVLLADVSDASELSIRRHAPPIYNEFDCTDRSFFIPLNDKSCVVSSNENAQWYVLVAGDPGLTFNLLASTQTQLAEEHMLSANSSTFVEAEAAVIQHYRIPKGPIGTALVIELIEHSDIDFNVTVKENLSDRVPVCHIRFDYRNDWHHCRLINDGIGDWYITVKNAAPGNYTIRTDEQRIIDLQPGISLRDQIGSSRYLYGQLYQVPTPEGSNTFMAEITDKTNSATLAISDDIRPTTYINRCRTRSGIIDASCSSNRSTPAFWYILVNADQGTEYTITTRFE